VADEMFVDVGAQRSVAAVEALMGSSMSQYCDFCVGKDLGADIRGWGNAAGSRDEQSGLASRIAEELSSNSPPGGPGSRPPDSCCAPLSRRMVSAN
jgi:hypothetical protein